ncbi:MAG TPA: ABC transporter permease subunit [Rhodanobacter sp.]
MNTVIDNSMAGLPRGAAGDRLLAWAFVAVPLLGLLLFFGYPLVTIGVRSFLSADHAFTLSNYTRLWTDPNVPRAALHSVLMAGATTVAVVLAGLTIAMALHRSRVPGKQLIRGALLLPMLAPSLMQGLGLIFLLGRNGLIHQWTGLNTDIYGFSGLLIANFCYALPQAVFIISVALARTDRRYYDAAETMGASAWRQFVDITLPQAKFGLLSAGFVVFTITITDFGNAIVVGGSYQVLATEIYDQVSGQMDFGMGATIGMILLLPAILSVCLERVASKHRDGGSEHALPFEAAPDRLRDTGLSVISALLLLPLVATIATVVYASFVKLWPYRLGLTLAHYHTDLPDGYGPVVTSLKVSIIVAVFGTLLLFMLALGVRRLPSALARPLYVAATLPAAVPGMIVGIAYVMAFNSGPLSQWLYGSIAIVALCNFYHFHTQGFLTMSTGLRSVPGALEDAVSCLGGRVLHSVRDVVLPFAAPAIVSVFFLLFMQSMVTLSAVIFLITPDLSLASVSVMQLNENGFVSQAAAYSTCIVVVVAAALALMRLVATRVSIHLQGRQQHVA